MARKKQTVLEGILDGQLDLFGDMKPCAIAMGRKGGIASGEVRRAKAQAKVKAKPEKAARRQARATKAVAQGQAKAKNRAGALLRSARGRIHNGPPGEILGGLNFFR